MRKLASHDKVIKKLQQLISITDITRLNKQTIELAINSNFKDFEDAIQNFSAIQLEKIDVIVTRNIKDYSNSDLAVMTPETYLKTIIASA